MESDRVDEARPHFEFLAADECANMLPDVEFPVILCGLARLSFRIEPGPAVLRPVYEQLAPFARPIQLEWVDDHRRERPGARARGGGAR